MNTNDLKIDLSRKLAEVNSRIIVLKNDLDDLTEQSEALQDVIVDLENIRDNILLQFNEIDKSTEAEHTKLPQLEKNIYKSFTSFEESFSKAGSLTRSSRLTSRDRSVDFKNPTGPR